LFVNESVSQWVSQSVSLFRL